MQNQTLLHMDQYFMNNSNKNHALYKISINMVRNDTFMHIKFHNMILNNLNQKHEDEITIYADKSKRETPTLNPFV